MMESAKRRFPFLPAVFCLLSCCLLGIAAPARAWEEEEERPGWEANTEPELPADAGDTRQEGPVRLARFSLVEGDVTWRGGETSEWSAASRNLPLRQGAQIWVADRGRAEIQFDDGSRLRLGHGALITLQTLYSDSEGEFTEITLNDGVVALRLQHERSIYQVNTPLVSVKATGPARLRVGAGDGVEVAVRQGRATVEGPQGKATLAGGDYLDLRDADSPLDLRRLPRPDGFDDWVATRDREIDADWNRTSRRYLPSNIALVADDLDDYGTWRNDAEYGYVWCPRVTVVNWRPYHYGRWVWCNPFGWTWVADGCDAPWGWAPYHYGTWAYRPYGWAWVPGPVNQYWCPAVVHFCENAGQVAWVPLAPREVRYPSFLSLGFRGRNWALYFSIGQAAVYYPWSETRWTARPWRSSYCNRVTYVTNVTNIYNTREIIRHVPHNYNTYRLNHKLVPINARVAAGATVAEIQAFGGRGAYRDVPRADTSLFTRGRAVGAPSRGQPLAGPPDARPTPLALTPARAFERDRTPSQSALTRPVFRAPIRSDIVRASQPIAPSGVALPAPRPNPFTSRSRTMENPPFGTHAPDRAIRTLPERRPTPQVGDASPRRREPNRTPENPTILPLPTRDERLRRPAPALPSGDRSARSGDAGLTPEAQAAQRARRGLGMRGSMSEPAREPAPRIDNDRGRQPDGPPRWERPERDRSDLRTHGGIPDGVVVPDSQRASEAAQRARRSLGFDTGRLPQPATPRDNGSRETPRFGDGPRAPRFNPAPLSPPERSEGPFTPRDDSRARGSYTPPAPPPGIPAPYTGRSRPGPFSPPDSEPPARRREPPRSYTPPVFTPRASDPPRREETYRAPRIDSSPRREAPAPSRPEPDRRRDSSNQNSGSGSVTSGRSRSPGR